jgi:hypothetical protein
MSGGGLSEEILSRSEANLSHEGTELLLHYDEGSPALLKVIEKQLGPNHPYWESNEKFRRPDNGQKEVKHRKEWFDMMFGYDSLETRKIISNKCRNSFNFSLPSNWRTLSIFSFTQNFPKCAAWLTYPSNIYYTMTIERGVLYAKKGKGKNAKVVPETKNVQPWTIYLVI